MKDYNWVKNRFGTRMANILRGLRKEVFEISENNDAKFKDTEGREYNVLTTQALQTKGSEAEQAFSTILANKSLIEVKWAELKDLRDTSKLIPGSLYRITDYQCTTIQPDTRSAGHQFDIVLLALSENKLAEEGWAMMHDNIYDVTFADNVTLKCYINSDTNYDGVFIVCDVENKLMIDSPSISDFDIDEETKTATTELSSTDLELPLGDVLYNYFQNSNLSAWKVWYCLDNDTSRFAWANPIDGIEDTTGNGECARAVSHDTNNLYAWYCEGEQYYIYTKSPKPQIGDAVYDENGDATGETVAYYSRHEGTGVIYRLIDEWNNDVPYDFKNIQFKRRAANNYPDMTSNLYNYFYTFTMRDEDSTDTKDASVFYHLIKNDEDASDWCGCNAIGITNNYAISQLYNSIARRLNNVVFVLNYMNNDSHQYLFHNNMYNIHDVTICCSMTDNLILNLDDSVISQKKYNIISNSINNKIIIGFNLSSKTLRIATSESYPIAK